MFRHKVLLLKVCLCFSILQLALAFLTRETQVQNELRLRQRLTPDYMHSVKDYEEFASVYMDRHSRDYYNSGAGQMQTLQDNEAAFKRLRLRPRLLRNVAYRNMSVNLLGVQRNIPFGASPVAFQRMAHPDGELGTGRAISAAGGVMIMSMLSTTSMEDMARKTPPGSVYWLQVYIAKDRDFSKKVIQRADSAGFKAIVVTIDSPVNGMWGVNMVHNLTLPGHLSLPNVQDQNAVEGSSSNLRNDVGVSLLDPALTWSDIRWIKKFTGLPIVVKGVLTAEDALLAVENGAAGILVSNHGGRQLDGVPATLDVLPEIVDAVKGKAEVFLDGGVRSGSDIFKALALGAKAVFFGRPVIWGLVHSGQQGVENIFRIMENGLDTTMALAGVSSLSGIQKTHVIKENSFKL